MNNYRAIALSAVISVFATLAVASPQTDKSAQREHTIGQQQQAVERRQDMERRRDDESRKGMESNQNAERRQDAEHRQDAGRRQDGVARSRAPGQFRADELMGQKVISRQSHRGVGKVAGFVTDDAGQIEAVIIEHGGIMGLFTNEVAVPRSQLEFSEDGRTIITNMNREQIRNSPRYERN